MSLHTSRLASLLATGLLAAFAACGGGGAGSGSSTPAAVVVQPPPAGDGSAAAPAAPKVTAPGPNVTPEGVVFNWRGPGKPQIYLAGNFNNWEKDNSQFLMKDDDGDGVWSITVKLAPGTYQYKYVIDGKWTQDSYAPGEAPDGYGGQNSQFDVK